jgi:hypothetical protein
LIILYLSYYVKRRAGRKKATEACERETPSARGS